MFAFTSGLGFAVVHIIFGIDEKYFLVKFKLI
jgi:hypothetical protein